MSKRDPGLIDRMTQSMALRLWQRRADAATGGDLNTLRTHRAEARGLKHQIDRFLHAADGRLALPRIGNSAFPKPPGSDWSWRPDLWRGPMDQPGFSSVTSGTRFGDEVALYHDCSSSELTLRQVRNTREADLAAFGLRMDVFRFSGSYLSWAIELPRTAVQGLTRLHVIRVDTIVELEKPLEIFARLNIRHGPNTEQVVQELPLNEQEIRTEFDLAYTRINENRLEKAWLDLIFEGPEMNQVILRDITVSRRLRAPL